jgi:predicted CoA-substrate-specific enzyme activase
MISAGCDLGSRTAKAVVMADNDIIGQAVIPASARPGETAKAVIQAALDHAGLAMEAIETWAGTGYGKRHIPLAERTFSEIACHGRGAVWQHPGIRTLVDIGGQDAKAVRLDGTGAVRRYVYNDKCASGTGRFLEIIAHALDVKLEDLGTLDRQAKRGLRLTSQCVVFAETEIISMVNGGEPVPDIVRAMHRAVAKRAASLAKSIQVVPRAAMSGGVALNPGMFTALEAALGTELVQLAHPQINGAIGAALLAREAP